MNLRRPLLSLLTLALFPSLLPADEVDRELVDPEGTAHQPLVVGTKKASVIFFVSPFCPTSNTFQPEMNAISSEFAGAFAFYSVHSDPGVSLDVAIQHRDLMEIPGIVLLDLDQAFAEYLGATITPEVIVMGPHGKTLYQGRINDLYLGPTRRQREATTRELRDALESIEKGEAVALPRTDPVGCDLPGRKKAP